MIQLRVVGKTPSILDIRCTSRRFPRLPRTTLWSTTTKMSSRVLRSASGSRSATPATGNAIVEEKSTSFKGGIDKFVSSTKTESITTEKSETKTVTKRKYSDVLSYKSGASFKVAKKNSSYAPPSKYAHLKGVPDSLDHNMLCMFIGLNPGIATSQAGHCYANPSNLFWRLMHKGGLTSRQCKPQEDVILPSEFNLGTTNIVGRPTASQAELSKEEMDDGVALLEEKCRKYRPEAVCIVGKAIWESIWRARHGGSNMTKAQFKFGWQDEKENMGKDKSNGYPGAKVYVVTSTSGLVAGYSMEFKVNLWKELGDWANRRRAERAEAVKNEDRGEGTSIAARASTSTSAAMAGEAD